MNCPWLQIFKITRKTILIITKGQITICFNCGCSVISERQSSLCVCVCFFVIIITFYFLPLLFVVFFSINTSSSVTDRYHVPSSIPQSQPAVQHGPTVMSQYPTHEKHVFSLFGGFEPRIPPRKNEDR